MPLNHQQHLAARAGAEFLDVAASLLRLAEMLLGAVAEASPEIARARRRTLMAHQDLLETRADLLSALGLQSSDE